VRVFVDTNVLLGVLAYQEEFYDASAGIWVAFGTERDRGI